MTANNYVHGEVLYISSESKQLQPVGCSDYLNGGDESPLLFFREIEALEVIHLLNSDGLSILRL